jgi:hypothetical protein
LGKNQSYSVDFNAFYYKKSEISTEIQILLCVKAAQGPVSVNADSGLDPKSKSRPKWLGPGSGSGQEWPGSRPLSLILNFLNFVAF